MVEKNLFSPDRKPPSDEEPAAEPQPGRPAEVGLPPRSVQLDGIFIRGDVKKALVRVNHQILGGSRERGSDPFPYISVSEGETIGDYKVYKIDFRSISLQKDNQLYTISLFMDGKVVPPPTPLPAAPVSPPQEPSPQSPAEKATPEQLQQALQTVLQQQQVNNQAPEQGASAAPQPPNAEQSQPAASLVGRNPNLPPRPVPRRNVSVPQPQ